MCTMRANWQPRRRAAGSQPTSLFPRAGSMSHEVSPTSYYQLLVCIYVKPTLYVRRGR
uniref:Uncharacterized protein n=1 Tax=Hyaloperonospora arabidopsidis (strain Emoy2) TaxID=559515 RepID=M4BP40_HYAAE